MEEFYEAALAQDFISQGGIGFAKDMLERAVGGEKAIEIMGRLSTYIRVTPFEFLRKIDPMQIFNFLQHEHPQTIALVMAYLPADGAAPGDGHVPAGAADRGRDAHRRDGPHGARGAARGRDGHGAQARRA